MKITPNYEKIKGVTLIAESPEERELLRFFCQHQEGFGLGTATSTNAVAQSGFSSVEIKPLSRPKQRKCGKDKGVKNG